jgi:hypothetical protein
VGIVIVLFKEMLVALMAEIPCVLLTFFELSLCPLPMLVCFLDCDGAVLERERIRRGQPEKTINRVKDNAIR